MSDDKERMTIKVDAQYAGACDLSRCCTSFDSFAFQISCDLILKEVAQTSGYTELSSTPTTTAKPNLNPEREPMMTVTRLEISDARVLIDGARARASQIGVPMCIAITDESGNLVAFERMNGGKVTSTTISIDKVFTAAGANKATHEYGEVSQPAKPAYWIDSAIGGRLMVVGGGLPVVVADTVVGGIGVSSGTPEQDRDVAQAGIDHFLKQLGEG